jgi:putative FmdB family regulatory protein
MPTYEYRCPKGHSFDVFQRMSDEPGAACPECGTAAERILSGGAGFIFKGDGFYITDYRSDDYKKAKASEVAGDSSAGGDGSGKSGAGSKGGTGDTGDTGGSKSTSKSSSSKDE